MGTNRSGTLSPCIEKPVIGSTLFIALLFVWVAIVGIHIVIGTGFFTKPVVCEENKTVLFSLAAFTYTMYYYSKDYLKSLFVKK